MRSLGAAGVSRIAGIVALVGALTGPGGPALAEVRDPAVIIIETAAFSLEMTVMIDDGSDSCGTDTSIVVEKGTMLRFCYTLTNTGDEALSLHDVNDSRIGQIAGPGLATVVAPGEGLALTATTSHQISALHGLTWEATGVESGTVVYEFDGLFVTVLGPEITLDITVMVDDGHGTCGTENELSVPPATQVRYCYTMTDTGDEPVNYHRLADDQLGVLLNGLDREVEIGEGLVHTEVAVIDETVTNTANWSATAQDTGADVDATDSVTVEVVDPDATTTTSTTTTVAEADSCATTPPAVTTSPVTSPPPTDATTTTASTTTTTSTTTSPTTSTTSTTSTTEPSFTTSTTSPILVLALPTTTLGEPAGFAGRQLDRPDAAPCPTTPPGAGGRLPATGSTISPQVVAALASAFVVSGGVVQLITRRPKGLDRLRT